MDYWKTIISLFETWGVPYDGNMVVDGADKLKEQIQLYVNRKTGVCDDERDYTHIITSLFAKWKIQYNTAMIYDGVETLKKTLSRGIGNRTSEIDQDILNDTLAEEKRQFTEDEYKKLHDLHGVNSPYGIGYYLGRVKQKEKGEAKENMISVIHWHPASEAPTVQWDKNPAISPSYLVKCDGRDLDGNQIIGYANYTYVNNCWMECIHATDSGFWRVTEWSDDKL